MLASILDWDGGQWAILIAAVALALKQWSDAKTAREERAEARAEQKLEMAEQTRKLNEAAEVAANVERKVDAVVIVPEKMSEKLDVIHGLVNGQTTQMLKSNLALAEDSLLKSRRLLELTKSETNGSSVASAEAAVATAKSNLEVHEKAEKK